MNFILKNWVRYCTKEVFKTLKIVTIGSAMIITVACVKYKPAYKVTLAGNTIGFISNREIIEAKISKYINDTTGNIAFREINELPEYEFKLINRDKETEEKNVMLAVQDTITTTYKFFAVTSDGEQKAVVKTQEEADNIINEIKADLNSEIDLKLGIVEIYTTEYNSSSKEDAKNVLNELKVAKVTEYQNKKAEEDRIAKENARKAYVASRARSYAVYIQPCNVPFHVSGIADVLYVKSQYRFFCPKVQAGRVDFYFGSFLFYLYRYFEGYRFFIGIHH